MDVEPVPSPNLGIVLPLASHNKDKLKERRDRAYERKTVCMQLHGSESLKNLGLTYLCLLQEVRKQEGQEHAEIGAGP